MHDALYTAFNAESFSVYKQFKDRKLCPGKTVDVYLADLRNLAVLFGGIPDRVMAYALVRALPVFVPRHIRAASRMDSLPLRSYWRDPGHL